MILTGTTRNLLESFPVLCVAIIKVDIRTSFVEGCELVMVHRMKD